MTTLKDALEAIRAIKIGSLKEGAREGVRKTKIADELLGRYKGIIPKGKTSTEFIRGLRNTLYGKIK